jgi:hypothetical protein
VQFLHNYTTHSFTHKSNSRGSAVKELVASTNEYIHQGRPVIMTRENMNRIILYLFYNKADPREYQQQGNIIDQHNAVYKNRLFLDFPCPFGRPEDPPNTVYVIKGECATPPEATVLKVIKRTDGTEAFKLLEQ